MEHWTWTVLNMASLAYFLLLETWQRFLSHSRATFGLREEAVETLSRAWRCSSVTLDLFLGLLKFKVEKSYLHKYVLPKRHMVRLNIREAQGSWGSFLPKIAQACLLFHSPPWTWLWIQSGTAGQSTPFETQEGHLARQRRRGPQKFEMWLCVSWSLQICGQIPPVASKWHQHTSQHCLHPWVPCLLGNGKGLSEWVGLSITQVLWRMLSHCHRQHWQVVPGLVTSCSVDLVDAFHNDRHHIVKLQASAAKGLLMDNAVQGYGLLLTRFQFFLNKCHQSIFLPSHWWHFIGCYSNKPLPWQIGIHNGIIQLVKYLLGSGLTMHWNYCDQLFQKTRV